MEEHNRLDLELYRYALELFGEMIARESGDEMHRHETPLHCFNDSVAKGLYAAAAARKDNEINEMKPRLRTLRGADEHERVKPRT